MRPLCPPIRADDHFGQLAGGVQRAGLDDGAGDAAGEAVFAVLPDQVGQFLLGQAVHQIGGA